jgi:hypothetical protein
LEALAEDEADFERWSIPEEKTRTKWAKIEGWGSRKKITRPKKKSGPSHVEHKPRIND